MSYITLALLSLAAFSVYNVSQKIVLKYLVDDSFVFSFYYYLFALLFFVPFILMGKVSGLNMTQFWPTALAGTVRTIMFVTYLWTFKKMDVTVITSMFNLRVILVALAEVVLLGTLFTWGDFGWMVVLIIGGIFLSMDENFNWRSFFTPVMGVFMIVLLLSTTQYMAIERAMAVTDFWTFNFWGFIFSMVGLIPFLIWQKKNIKLPMKTIGISGLVTTTMLAGVLLESKAVAINPTGSSAIFALPGSMMLAMVVGLIKPGLIEDHSWKVYAVRLVSVAVMTVAVWQLVG